MQRDEWCESSCSGDGGMDEETCGDGDKSGGVGHTPFSVDDILDPEKFTGSSRYRECWTRSPDIFGRNGKDGLKGVNAPVTDQKVKYVSKILAIPDFEV
ncbi:hypothetical protein JTE90_029459 [Oedothorax gibbosus]|uniref:Uncharacterized protein n=1 Tax=Oedothorax gibbosus TaxID=931172 RepID=A0AAV6V407_9ARAC|nr:hypothetical protein JTE90_029459 [Oedothorax gibbosus]